MTTAVSPLRTDVTIIGQVCVAHLMSHFYALVVPPLFVMLTEEFGVGYAAMGFATSMFYVASGLLQTPAGFAVDRLGGKAGLVGGLAGPSAGPPMLGFAPADSAVRAVAGTRGWVVAPLFSGVIGTAFRWRAPSIGAGAIGHAVALLLAFQP